MGAITGITAAISWTGTENAYLASTGVEPGTFSINFEGDNHDVTTFSTTGPKSQIKGLRALSFEWTAQLKSADHGGGSNGLVTFAAGTVLNLDTWNMDITRNEHRVTAFTDTVHKYIPGLWGASGGFSGFLDDTTAMTDIGGSNASEPATGTFKYQEKGATDNTLSGSIFTTAADVSVSPLEPNRYGYTYQVSGDITHSTPSAGVGILPSGAIAGSAAGALVLTASTGRTFTTAAFWTSISITCQVGTPTVVRVRARSSDGAMALG